MSDALEPSNEVTELRVAVRYLSDAIDKQERRIERVSMDSRELERVREEVDDAKRDLAEKGEKLAAIDARLEEMSRRANTPAIHVGDNVNDSGDNHSTNINAGGPVNYASGGSTANQGAPRKRFPWVPVIVAAGVVALIALALVLSRGGSLRVQDGDGRSVQVQSK